MLEVVRIPVLSDNYVWLLHDPRSQETVVIDPAVAEPVLEAAAARGWTIGQIWNTHWHGDHVGGNAAIKAATGCIITGPAAEAEKIATLDHLVGEGDSVRIGDHVATVMAVPASTMMTACLAKLQAPAAARRRSTPGVAPSASCRPMGAARSSSMRS